MPSIRIPGVPDPASRPLLAETVEGVKPMQSVRVEAGRAAHRVEALEGDFVEIELTGGFRLWAPTDRIEADLGAVPSRDGPTVLPTSLALGGGATRGRGTDIAIQAVRTFELQIAGAIADFIKNRVEQGREPGGRLNQCVATSAATFAPAKNVAGAGPTLVFIHGTASSTDGSFGGLWEAVGANRILRLENPGARINDLFKHYDGRVLAFEHRSISESPIVNALTLMEQLAEVVPGGREVHLVSHSRGGLIGELLCRGMRIEGDPIDDVDLGLFTGAKRAPDREALPELGRLLKQQQYQIGRFVRVACPAAGTTLADKRLDRYFSILVNVAGRIGGLAANPAYEALTSLLAAVLKQRAEPDSLPGLEAMMPLSPLSQMVNRGDAKTNADLHVLGGDLAAEGFWSALKTLATNWYYREDHDLVVNTPSMLRGAPRPGPIKYWIDEGGEVTHFNYFRRSDTAGRLTDILEKGEADLREVEVPPDAVAKIPYQKRDAAELPVLVLVPGFMGSHLEAHDGRLWADAARLAKGGFASLAKGKVTAAAVVGLYADLVTHLSATHKVEAFPYDWRLKTEDNADALRQFIEERLPKGDGASALPLRVLTHGAGGLVFQAMLASDDGRALWERLSAQPGARAVVLGYPFGGTVHALLPLLDCGPLLDGLDVADLKTGRDKLRSALAGFDGLVELLPAVAAATWKAAKDAEAPDAKRLAEAGARRVAYTAAEVFDPRRVVLVAGTADRTPTDVTFQDGVPTLSVTSDGDGYSAWNQIPATLWPAVRVARADFGGLVTSREMQPAIVELLMTGSTTRLGSLPPSSRDRERGKALDAAAPTVRLHALQEIPSHAELVAAGLGLELQPPVTAVRRVRVNVVYGNLSRATSPVVVGHYANDAIVNAEAYLDGQLQGRLRRRQLMRLYPEAIGTAAVEIQPSGVGSVHPGAIVVGLGVVGDLTPGLLRQTIENGLVEYGANRVSERLQSHGKAARGESKGGARGGEAAAPEAVTSEVAAPVTALLVGSGEAGITLRDSLHALLRAVRGANDRLAAPAEAARTSGAPVPVTARIDALDIYELYEDRAVEAMRTVVDLMRDTEVGDLFEAEPLLTIGEDGQQRVSFEERAAWWQRLKVTEQSASLDPEVRTDRRILKFEAFTERARIDAYAVNSLRQQADAFIADAAGATGASENVGKALFEILVPNAIKDRAPDQRNTVLLLDTKSATIPWELFEDGLPTDRRPRGPLAVEAGLIRQLVDEHGRQQIRQSTGKSALVIGDPVVTDARFVPLPGAAEEASIVAGQLAGDYDVKPLIGNEATPRAIMAALHERPWRVVHLAMHGVIDFPFEAGKPEPKVTGAVAGAGMYLTAEDFNQMRYVPDLVFLNCCHGGSTAADARRPPSRYPELAANLATQFIKMGSRAVVAAGWAVNDSAAQAFAQTFYVEMLAGQTFGEATLRARKEIYRRFGNVNTWGAYQCYGDPAFRLVDTASASAALPLYHVREAVVAVRRLANQTRIAGDAEAKALGTQLDALVGRTPQRWRGDSTLCAEIGHAYGELSDFDRAIDYYKRAGTAEEATLTVKALEQRANLEGRYAEHLWRDAKKKDKDAALRATLGKRFDEAKAILEQLNTFGKSVERLSLLGGLAKRRAMTLADTAAIAVALREAEECYGAASALAKDRDTRDAFWPRINAVVAKLTRSWIEPPAAPGASARVKDRRAKLRRKGDAPAPAPVAPSLLAKELEELKAIAAEKEENTDLWSAALVAEFALVSALDSRKPEALASSELIGKYREAQQRGRSRRESDSIITQVRFLAAMAKASPLADVKKLAPPLDDLVRQLNEG